MQILKNLGTAILLTPLMIILMMNIFTTGIAGLTGYEQISPICSSVRDNNQTRLEYLIFPLAEHLCKKDAGLLQPQLKNFAEWLNEVPK